MDIQEFIEACDFIPDSTSGRLRDIIPQIDDTKFATIWNKGKNDLDYDEKVRVAFYKGGLSILDNLEGKYLELHALNDVAGFVLVYSNGEGVQSIIVGYKKASELIDNT